MSAAHPLPMKRSNRSGRKRGDAADAAEELSGVLVMCVERS